MRVPIMCLINPVSGVLLALSLVLCQAVAANETFPELLTDLASDSLRVVIEPAAARSAGARWRRLGTTLWRESGQVETNVPPGQHTVEFQTVAGWSVPAQPLVTVATTPLPTQTGHYAPQTGNLWHVDDSNTSGTEDGTSLYPFISVQAAVVAAQSGDTIKVARGDYGGVDTQGKGLTLLGGYPGATPADYAAGLGGQFANRLLAPGTTTLRGGDSAPGIRFTRFDDSLYWGMVDNLRVTQSRKGIVCDTVTSWPHPDNLTITNTLVEENGQVGEQSAGGGISICAGTMRIMNSSIRNNHGGFGAGIFGQSYDLLIQANRIEGNVNYSDHGGGLFLGGHVRLLRNLIAGNRIAQDWGWGGGLIYVYWADTPGASLTSEANVIRHNVAPNYGGGIFIDEGATATLKHDLIHHNTTATGHGGGIGIDNGDPGPSQVSIDQCTVAHNNADYVGDPYWLGGNGIFVDSGSTATVTNSLFWSNGDDFYVRENAGSALVLNWSLSQEAWPGIGNRSTNPLFANPTGGDFHLRSTRGRYDPGTGQWVIDTHHSPAIDAGDPNGAFDQEPAPNGGRLNQGVFGNSVAASLSRFCWECLPSRGGWRAALQP